jgi:hypothetical protein
VVSEDVASQNDVVEREVILEESETNIQKDSTQLEKLEEKQAQEVEEEK